MNDVSGPADTTGGVASPADLADQLAAQRASADQLTNVRATAEKWAGAIGTIISLFTLSGLVKGPDDFAKVRADWQPAIPLLLGLGVAFGLAATLSAVRAAYGLPGRALLVGAAYASIQAKAAETAARSLFVALAAAVASFVLIAAAVGVIWFAPRAAPGGTLTLLTTSTSVVCGNVTALDRGDITIDDTVTGQVVTTSAVSIQTLESVTACPQVSK